MTNQAALQLDSLSKQKFRSAFREEVEDGHIQYLSEGNPFTLILSHFAARKFADYGVRLHAIESQVTGHADGINMRFQWSFDWYDKDTQDKKDKGKNFGLMTYFDNNMDSLMQAIRGIRVAVPSSQVSRPYRVGALAHDALAIS